MPHVFHNRPRAAHTQRDSPGGSMRRGHRRFWPNNKENRHTFYANIISLKSMSVFFVTKWMNYSRQPVEEVMKCGIQRETRTCDAAIIWMPCVRFWATVSLPALSYTISASNYWHDNCIQQYAAHCDPKTKYCVSSRCSGQLSVVSIRLLSIQNTNIMPMQSMHLTNYFQLNFYSMTILNLVKYGLK